MALSLNYPAIGTLDEGAATRCQEGYRLGLFRSRALPVISATFSAGDFKSVPLCGAEGVRPTTLIAIEGCYTASLAWIVPFEGGSQGTRLDERSYNRYTLLTLTGDRDNAIQGE